MRPSGILAHHAIHRRGAARVDDALLVGEHHAELLAVTNHLRHHFLIAVFEDVQGQLGARAARPPGGETAAIVPAACYYYHFRAARRAARHMILKLKRTPGIFLTGFMGCGKTTVGRALADELGWTFADLDEEIEAREKTTIAEIFDTHGEAAFREIETEVLKDARPYRAVWAVRR